MKILISKADASRPQLVLVFGLGLIGSAINESLVHLGFQELESFAFDWNSDQQITRALHKVEQTCMRSQANLAGLSLVWSAGKTGFFSSENETDKEYLLFERMFVFLLGLRKKLQPLNMRFHFISSAGGLFEGQRVVRLNSNPSPMRPYGMLKRRQETLLSESLSEDELIIYRPSSVFGPTRRKNRQGLINTLIDNARNGCVTVLDAHVMSLRDYVFAGDIGNYISRKIRFEFESKGIGSVQFLVSAKCSSIFEVVEKIKRILNLQIQFRYDDQFGNHKNITFSDSVMPSGWRPSTLEMGIRQFMPGR